MVPRRRLELPRSRDHWHLKPARLPIPPPGPSASLQIISQNSYLYSLNLSLHLRSMESHLINTILPPGLEFELSLWHYTALALI